MKVKVKDFKDKYLSSEYKHGMYLPEDLFCQIISSTEPFIELPDDIIEIIEKNKSDEEKHEKLYDMISSHRIMGMEKEQESDINGAIDEYSKSIEIGETTDMFHAYAYSYERIIILLDKMKEYNQEIRYISQYLQHDLDDKRKEKYQNRLAKLNSKLNK